MHTVKYTDSEVKAYEWVPIRQERPTSSEKKITKNLQAIYYVPLSNRDNKNQAP